MADDVSSEIEVPSRGLGPLTNAGLGTHSIGPEAALNHMKEVLQTTRAQGASIPVPAKPVPSQPDASGKSVDEESNERLGAARRGGAASHPGGLLGMLLGLLTTLLGGTVARPEVTDDTQSPPPAQPDRANTPATVAQPERQGQPAMAEPAQAQPRKSRFPKSVIREATRSENLPDGVLAEMERIVAKRNELHEKYAEHENNRVKNVEILGTESNPNNPNADLAVRHKWEKDALRQSGTAETEHLHIRITREDGSQQEGYIAFGGVVRGETLAVKTYRDENGNVEKMGAAGSPIEGSPLRAEGDERGGLLSKLTMLRETDTDRVGTLNLGTAKDSDGISVKEKMRGAIKASLNSLDVPEVIPPVVDKAPADSVTLAKLGMTGPKAESRLLAADVGSAIPTLGSPQTPSSSPVQAGTGRSRGDAVNRTGLSNLQPSAPQ